MKTVDFNKLPTFSSPDSVDKDVASKLDHEISDGEARRDLLNGETLANIVHDVDLEEGQLPETDVTEHSVGNSVVLHESVIETVVVSDNYPAKSGCMNVEDETVNSYLEKNGTCFKRPREAPDEPQPAVHIKYTSLPRDSKQKLEELLQHWSEWHGQYYSASRESNGVLESGEGTYFPALHVGADKSSSVAFWIDNQTNLQNKDVISINDKTVPLYDREYASALSSIDGLSNLEGGLETVDDSRCFNCGSYNHALKGCPKPRDNVAVNSARKQHKAKRNQTPGSRNSTRYYQSTPGGKYEGLRPGALDPDTRKLLGLGEFDPPPWLTRMRRLGYPPGYLDPDDGDQPSGITIFCDEETKVEHEDGEILQMNPPEPPKKMSVEFPGINAPIPKDADERLWAAGPSTSDPFRQRDSGRSESYSRGLFREQRSGGRDFRDDVPPSCEPVYSPPGSAYPRYGDYGSNYNSQSSRIPRSPSYGRSHSDRSRNGHSEDSSVYSSYSSFSYPSSSRRFSERNNGADDFTPENYSSRRSREKDNRYRHRSGRLG